MAGDAAGNLAGGSAGAGPLTAAVVDRASPVPYYHQLKVILRAMIDGGVLRPGDALPGELRLCEQYDVSRTVVRQALVELEHEGRIERRKGRGTFVSTPRTPQGLVQSLSGQFEDMAARGLHLRSVVRRLEVVPAAAEVAARMGLTPGGEVLLLDRLRSVLGEPWVVVLTYLPAHLLPALRAADLEGGSLYTVLDGLGLRPVTGHRTVEAREAGRGLAADLGIRRTAPVLLLTSLGLDPAGRPVEYFEAYHRGDRSRLDVDLVRRDGVLTAPVPVPR